MVNKIVVIALILVSICIIYFNYNIKNNIENFSSINNCNSCVNWPNKDKLMGLWDTKQNKCVAYENGSGKFNFEGDRGKWIVMSNKDGFWNGLQQKSPSNCPSTPKERVINSPISSLPNFSGLDSKTLSAIKQEINRQYNMDIEAIRNLGAISKSLLTGRNYHSTNSVTPGTLTIPGDVKILGKLDIDNNLIVNSNNFNILPKGMIMAWAYTNIPAGWAKCDGQNGTPDLRSRFILGEGHGGGLSNRQRNHRGGSETHKLTVHEMPSHTHTYSRGWSGHKTNDTADGNEPHDDFWKHQAHTTHATGGNHPHNNMPPFHVLIYIMKL